MAHKISEKDIECNLVKVKTEGDKDDISPVEKQDLGAESVEKVSIEEIASTKPHSPKILVHCEEVKSEPEVTVVKSDEQLLESTSSPIKEEEVDPKHEIIDFSEDTKTPISDISSKVTLKRKSDSLALISSYDISSESDDELHGNAFSKPQSPPEVISSDSDTDSGSIFNLDSDDASDESSQSSGEDNTTDDKKGKKTSKGAKATKMSSCLDLGELPPIKDLQISVKEDECLPFGRVHSIVETLVVIESFPDVPALNLESVLFTKNGEPLGEVFDVFGPVKRPYYTIRFKCQKDIDEKGLLVGVTVYCAPKTKYTQYVFIHQLARMKGSDASWKNDIEPPPEYLDYSDDEQERLAKKALKEAKVKAKAMKVIDVDAPPIKIPSFEERMNQRNTLRNQMFIRNPSPDTRADWFRTNLNPNGDTPGTSSGGLVRAPQFTPPQMHRQNSPRTSPFFSQNLARGNPGSSPFSYPIRNQIFNNVLHIRGSIFSASSNQNMLNTNPFLPNRSPPSFSQNGPIYQGNNNHPFPANSPSFSQQNSGPFQPRNCPFPFPQNRPMFQGSQLNKGNASFIPTPNPNNPFTVRSPPFQPHMNSRPFGKAPMFQSNNMCVPPPVNLPSPLPRPLQPNSPPGFALSSSRPYPANSPPFPPPPFSSYTPNMPPQNGQNKSYYPSNGPFSSNTQFSQSFRPFKPN